MLENRRRQALTAFVILGAAVTGLTAAGPFLWAIPLKPLPVLCLAARVALAVPWARSRTMLAALVLGAAGDLTLALQPVFPSEITFLLGLGLFLVGHLFYLATFAVEAQPRAPRLAAAAALWLMTAAALTLVAPHLGPMRAPVMVYAGILTTMAVTAALRRGPRWTVFLGATLFVVSDTLIAVNRFLAPLPLADLWILGTYFPAQYLIAEGWTRDQLDEGPARRARG